MANMTSTMAKHNYDAALAGTPEKPLAFAIVYRGKFPVALVSPAKSGTDLISRVSNFFLEEKITKGALFKGYDKSSSLTGPCGLIWQDSGELKIQIEKDTFNKAKESLRRFFHATHNKQPSISEGKLADGVQGFVPEDLNKWLKELDEQRSESQVSKVVTANSDGETGEDEQGIATEPTLVPALKPLPLSDVQLKALDDVGHFRDKMRQSLLFTAQRDEGNVSEVSDLTGDLQKLMEEFHDDGLLKDTDVNQLMLRLKLDVLNESIPNRSQDVVIGHIREKFSQAKPILEPGVVADQLFEFAKRRLDTGEYDLRESHTKTIKEKISKEWPKEDTAIDLLNTVDKLQIKMIRALSNPDSAMHFIGATRFKKDVEQRKFDEKKIEEMLTSWSEGFMSVEKSLEAFIAEAEMFYIGKKGHTIREDNGNWLPIRLTIDGIRHCGLESSLKCLKGLKDKTRKEVGQCTLDLIAAAYAQASGPTIQKLESVSEDYSIGQDCRSIIEKTQKDLQKLMSTDVE